MTQQYFDDEELLNDKKIQTVEIPNNDKLVENSVSVDKKITKITPFNALNNIEPWGKDSTGSIIMEGIRSEVYVPETITVHFNEEDKSEKNVYAFERYV